MSRCSAIALWLSLRATLTLSAGRQCRLKNSESWSAAIIVYTVLISQLEAAGEEGKTMVQVFYYQRALCYSKLGLHDKASADSQYQIQGGSWAE